MFINMESGYDYFTWLHLTDLHWTGNDAEQQACANAMVEDLSGLMAKMRTTQIDAVLFSGDMVDKGNKAEFYSLSENVLTPLRKMLAAKGKPPLFMAVPGNHDLKRPSQPDDADKIQVLQAVAAPKKLRDINTEAIISHIDVPNLGEIVQAAFLDYIEWEAKERLAWELARWQWVKDGGGIPSEEPVLKNYSPLKWRSDLEFSLGDFARTLETLGGRKIGILGLNTTFLQLLGNSDFTPTVEWFNIPEAIDGLTDATKTQLSKWRNSIIKNSGGGINYRGALAFDFQQQVSAALGIHTSKNLSQDLADWRKKHDASILMTHQGPAWLTPSCLKALTKHVEARDFGIHLFGHMHEPEFRFQEFQLGPYARRQCQGSALYAKDIKPHVHGYSVGQFTLQSDLSSARGTRGVTVRYWPRRKPETNADGPFSMARDPDWPILCEDDGSEHQLVSGDPVIRPKVRFVFVKLQDLTITNFNPVLASQWNVSSVCTHPNSAAQIDDCTGCNDPSFEGCCFLLCGCAQQNTIDQIKAILQRRPKWRVIFCGVTPSGEAQALLETGLCRSHGHITSLEKIADDLPNLIEILAT